MMVVKNFSLPEIRTRIDEFLWPEPEPRRRRNRERILQAATERFARLGYRKTSIDEVARRAGVAKGTVYLYYRNKAELAYHAIALEKRTHLSRLQPVLDAALPPQDLLRAVIALGIVVSREMPLTSSPVQGDHEIALALREIDAQVVADVSRRQMEIMMQLLRAAADAAVPADELETRCRVLLDMLTVLATSAQLNATQMSLERYAGVLADIIVDGMINRVASPHAVAGLALALTEPPPQPLGAYA